MPIQIRLIQIGKTKMNIKGKDIKAVIFDLDGTLIDSNDVWKKVDEEFFAKRNRKIPEGYVEAISHVGLFEAALITINKFNIQGEPNAILEEWKNSAYQMYANEVKLKPYVKELLDKLKKEKIYIALATACNKDLYIPCLQNRKIYDYFDIIADVDDVKEGKSSAKIYQFISSKLNISPSNTVVVEDISIGLKSAYESGYLTIGIYDKSFSFDEENKKKYSYLYINSFQELLKLN